jgi:hypothetical protein
MCKIGKILFGRIGAELSSGMLSRTRLVLLHAWRILSRNRGWLPSSVARFFFVQHTKTGKYIPDEPKIYKMTIKYTEWPYNRPNGHKICICLYQHFSFQDHPKFTQNWDFGLKTNHLATLLRSLWQERKIDSAQVRRPGVQRQVLPRSRLGLLPGWSPLCDHAPGMPWVSRERSFR